MGFILATIAVLLTYIFSPFLIIYSLFVASSVKEINAYFKRIAVAVDRLGNVIGAPFFNYAAIKSEGDKFGDGCETISSVLGKNHLRKPRPFKLLGRSLRYYLDRIEKDHCVNSIGE